MATATGSSQAKAKFTPTSSEKYDKHFDIKFMVLHFGTIQRDAYKDVRTYYRTFGRTRTQDMKMNREEKTYRYNSDEATTQVSKVLF